VAKNEQQMPQSAQKVRNA